MEPEMVPGANRHAPSTEAAGQKEDGGTDSSAAKEGHLSRRRVKPSEDALPPPETIRWVIRRKAQVVMAVQAGAITLEEVCRRYSISVEEFHTWRRSLERHGLYGLRTTRVQIYRDKRNSNDTLTGS